MPLLTCHCEPSRLILLLINGAVCWASQGKSRTGSHSPKPPFICPQQMGPLRPLARLHLMRSASFILISEQVPEQEPPDLQMTSVTCPPSQSYSEKQRLITPVLSGLFPPFFSFFVFLSSPCRRTTHWQNDRSNAAILQNLTVV